MYSRVNIKAGNNTNMHVEMDVILFPMRIAEIYPCTLYRRNRNKLESCTLAST